MSQASRAELCQWGYDSAVADFEAGASAEQMTQTAKDAGNLDWLIGYAMACVNLWRAKNEGEA